MAKKISDELLLSTLLTTSSQTEAAKILKINKQTVCRRASQPEFKEKLSQYRKQILENTSTKIINATLKAVDVLDSLLESKNEMTKYSAASRLLSLAGDYLDRCEIIARLDKLEQLQKENANDD
jgi:intergrase/recombinase